MHILPNISRNKDNQKIKFSQLVEYNMRNTSVEKAYQECGGEETIFPDPFLGNQN